MMEKSANKRWKESNTSLTFKEWIDRENKKNEVQPHSFIPFDGTQPVDTSAINQTLAQAQSDILTASGYKSAPSTSTVFGLDKNILIFSGFIIAGSIGAYFYYKAKKK